MKQSVRPSRASSSFLLVLALVTAIAAIAAKPARGCIIGGVEIVDGFYENDKATVGRTVTFEIRFAKTAVASGSVRIDYGDGPAEDVGLKPVSSTQKFNHVYTRPGEFNVSFNGDRALDAGKAQPGCPRFLFIINVENDHHSRVQRPTPTPTAHTLARAKSSVAAPPASGQSMVGTAKGITAHVFAPGQIARASVLQSVLGYFLKVEGSGKCGLKVYEELDGKALRTYDFKGPLPTTIQLNGLPGVHVVKIEGDGSSEGCGGTASTFFGIAKPKGIF